MSVKLALRQLVCDPRKTPLSPGGCNSYRSYDTSENLNYYLSEKDYWMGKLVSRINALDDMNKVLYLGMCVMA